MIKINVLEKKYKNFSLYVKNTSIQKGEKIAIVGKNGSGKTTFIETLFKLKKATNLQAQIHFQKINGVFQNENFDSNFKVMEIVQIFASLYKVNFEPMDFIEKFGFTNKQNNKYSSLSAGEKQKLKILIAFLNKPEFLILDEVSTSLDISWQKKIIKIIKTYFVENKNASLLLVTHSLNDIKEICDQVWIFNEGKIIEKIKISKANREKVIKQVERKIYE